jgi:hypothetical protein
MTMKVTVILETLQDMPVPAELTGPEEVFVFGLAHQQDDIAREVLCEFEFSAVRVARAKVEGFRRGQAMLRERGGEWDPTSCFERAGDRRLRVEVE